MNDSQKEALIKLAEVIESQLPYLYNTIGAENMKLLAEAIHEVKSVMRE